jgi:hypothetical protein
MTKAVNIPSSQPFQFDVINFYTGNNPYILYKNWFILGNGSRACKTAEAWHLTFVSQCSAKIILKHIFVAF